MNLKVTAHLILHCIVTYTCLSLVNFSLNISKMSTLIALNSLHFNTLNSYCRDRFYWHNLLQLDLWGMTPMQHSIFLQHGLLFTYTLSLVNTSIVCRHIFVLFGIVWLLFALLLSLVQTDCGKHNDKHKASGTVAQSTVLKQRSINNSRYPTILHTSEHVWYCYFVQIGLRRWFESNEMLFRVWTKFMSKLRPQTS